MTKSRIFIHMHYMELGGAEKALIGLLDAIDKGKYDVDLFLNQHTGPFMSQIPAGVNLLPEIPEYAALEQSIPYSIKNRLWKSVLNKAKRKLKFASYLKKKTGYGSVSSHFMMDYSIKSLPSLEQYGEYDLAVSFLDPPHVVQDKVRAKKKVEWIHTDFATIPYDTDLTYDRWAANDYIISISDDISEGFSKVFPTLRDKLYKIENIISPQFIRLQARENIDDINHEEGYVELCSIGRLTEQKNFKIVPQVCAILKERGLKFRWRIIGQGDQSELIALIEKHDVGDCLILTGPKNNPYPYIANADIYIQPSIYEGKSIAVREAQILCKPVIITRYPTSGSQITDGVDGVICEIDALDIARAIMDLYEQPQKMTALSDYLKNHDYGMMSEVDKFYKLI